MQPSHVYHASPLDDLAILEPRDRYVHKSLYFQHRPILYAAADPAYASGHGFAWSSDEGIDIHVDEEGVVILEVPAAHAHRLQQQVCIYTLPASSFTLLRERPLPTEVVAKEAIYISYEPVTPITTTCFATVQEAVLFYGGKVVIRK